MFQKLAALEKRYEELSVQLSDPSLVADPKAYRQVAQAHADLEEVVEKYREHRTTQKALLETRQMLKGDVQ